jgi:hypothetical protein
MYIAELFAWLPSKMELVIQSLEGGAAGSTPPCQRTVLTSSPAGRLSALTYTLSSHKTWPEVPRLLRKRRSCTRRTHWL